MDPNAESAPQPELAIGAAAGEYVAFVQDGSCILGEMWLIDYS